MDRSAPDPKPFQKATARAATAALRREEGPRRFLIADEVGLGKTIVARTVLESLIDRSDQPLNVFYVCSNRAIARQNQDQLLKLLPTKEERERARCDVDRLTLLPVGREPDHPDLRLYTLTPATSVPTRKGQRRDGRKEERALIHHLVVQLWPRFFQQHDEDFFQRNATRTWEKELEWRRKAAYDPKLRRLFERSVRRELRLEPRRWVLPVLTELARADELDAIARLRNALALGALENIRPDLVIFDEFQRFRDLLRDDQDDSASRIIRAIRGDDNEKAGLLLLSATPYRLYTQRWESADGSGYAEFRALVGDLYRGDGEREAKLECLDLDLRRLRRHVLAGTLNSAEATASREGIRRLLRPVMARTERLSSSTEEWSRDPKLVDAALHAEDVDVFRHLAESLSDHHRSAAVSLWSSIPYPMQAMGSDYKTWTESDPRPARGVPCLTREARDRFEAPVPAHPRYRALLEHLDRQVLSLPWIAPTLPWWRLGGPWEAAKGQKALVFSRYRATPRAHASLTSYLVETLFLSGDPLDLHYAEVTQRRLLSASEGRHGLPWLFHPSPFLVESTDPVVALGRSLEEVKAIVREQLREALNSLGLRVDVASDRLLTPWQLGIRLEERCGTWGRSAGAWRSVEEQQRSDLSEEAGGALRRTIARWAQEADETLEFITETELETLTELSLGAPGVIVGRALLRHWDDTLTTGLEQTLSASWVGLRNYLDQRWFASMLRGEEGGYPDAIVNAVVQGNLESSLDEHLWAIGQLRGLEGRDLARELTEGWQVMTSSIVWHSAEAKVEEMRLRCHAAMAFGDQRQFRTHGKGDAGRIRADELRKGFNTPFFPHLLSTTSVGQEGLDFHTWCSTVVHWDLPSNPVDLEQREGRVSRYGGLSIRRAIAERLASRFASSFLGEGSPWQHMASLAEDDLADDSGLKPWWICEGAGVDRWIVGVPTSEQWEQWRRLQRERLLYRMVLGQPNQEDLLEVLSDKLDKQVVDPEQLRDYWISLSPWFDGSHVEPA